MEIYISGRQFGKTTMLIKESARTGATIAVATYHMAMHVKSLARRLGLDIPEPVTYYQIFHSYRENEKKRYLVDELQMMLGQLNVDICTVDRDPIRFLYPWSYQDGYSPKVTICDETDERRPLMDRQFKRFDLPNHTSLGIREFMEQIHYNTVQKMDDLIFSAFRSLGYTRDWIFMNRNRIRVDRVAGSPLHEHVIYYLDNRPLFAVGQTTEIRMENGVYKFLADWQVQYFKEGESYAP